MQSLIRLLILVICAVRSACEILNSDLDESRAVYIRYNGSISAQYTKPGCGSLSIPAEKASTLYVGVYPLWDSNPLFFDLQHTVSEDCNQVDCPFDYSQGAQKIAWSYDDLQYLYFRSADYACYKDGEICGSGVTVNPYYVQTQLLDLEKATINRVDEGSYLVHGDEKSWVSNDTVISGFRLDVSGPGFNTSLGNQCASDEMHFIWNSTVKFNYTVQFSNYTASAEVSFERAAENVVIKFNGSRVDDYGYGSIYFDRNGKKRSANLDTSDPNVPNYVWSNGDKVIRADLDNPFGGPTTTSPGPAATSSMAMSISTPSVKGLWASIWVLYLFHSN